MIFQYLQNYKKSNCFAVYTPAKKGKNPFLSLPYIHVILPVAQYHPLLAVLRSFQVLEKLY